MPANDTQINYDINIQGFEQALPIHQLFVFLTAHYAALINTLAILSLMKTGYAHSLTGIDIHPGVKIGESDLIRLNAGLIFFKQWIIQKGKFPFPPILLGGD